MKKTLAIILSIALTLSLCAGLFVFPASADATTKDYATTKAEELWASTKNKAEIVRVTLNTSVEGASAISFVIANNETVTLTEKGGFTAGTMSLKDGVLTLDKVAYNTATDNCFIEPAGAATINITGGDFYGYIRNDLILTEKLDDPNSDVPEDKIDGPYVNTATTDNHILVTSDGHTFYGHGTGGNKLRARGAIVVYGNVGIVAEAPAGYHDIISEQAGTGSDIIIAPAKDSLISVGAYGPAIENRSGSVIFAGKAKITLKGTASGNSTNGKQLINVTAAAKSGSSVQFLEDVSITFDAVSQGAVYVDAVTAEAKDVITFNTTGTVKYTSTTANVTTWASVFMANYGSISVLKGTVLVNLGVATYTDGSYHAFGMNNNDGDLKADRPNVNYDNKFTVANDAEVVVYVNSAATATARLGAFWGNGITAEFKDNAKFSVGMNFAAKGHGSTHMVTVKVGAIIVTDNAKLFFADLPGSNGNQNAIQIQYGNHSATQLEYWKGKMGYFQDGGQVEINTGYYAIANEASNKNPNEYESGLKITDGVVNIYSETKTTFGKNPDAPAAPYYCVTTGYVYAGEVGKDASNVNNRGVNNWIYMGEDDAYTPYNGLLDHAAEMGITLDYVTTALTPAANTISVPAAGNYTVTADGEIKLGDKVVPNGATITLKYGDVLTGKGITIAMTKKAASVPAAPANLKVVDGSVTSSGAKVTWDAADYAVSYNVYANGTLVGSTDKTELQMTLMSNTEYAITVKGVNFSGEEGAASAAATLTTEKGASDFTKPAAPANVKVAGIGKTSATVTWDAVADATSYDVYLNGEKANESPVTATSFDLSGLTAATDYKVQVTASNLAGASDKSAEVAFKTGLEGVADKVVIVLADGSTVELTALKPTATIGTGTATYNAATGVITIENINGAQAIQATNAENLTICVKGTNTLENTSQANALRALNLVLEGDGTLNLKSTYANAYVVLGQQSVTFRGSLKFNLDVIGGNAAVHGARGGNGQCFILVEDDVQINAKNDTNRLFYVAGENSGIIITDNAIVNLETTKSDAICALSASDKPFEGDAKAYAEVSGNAKLTIKAGSCGIRLGATIKGTKDAPIVRDGTTEVIFKDNAVIDITAPGQVVYCSYTAEYNTGAFKGIYTQSGKANVKLTNNGNYAGLDVRGTKDNEINILGGSLEIYAPNKSAINIAGKTTFNTGKAVLTAGESADAATAVDALNSTAKYFKITSTNPPTSDVSYVAVATAAVIAVLAGAAVVILRKKSENN